MRQFGLIGYPLSHSFSKKYFTEKFEKEGLTDCRYDNYSLAAIADLQTVLTGTASLEGLNVTIPYKEQVLPFLSVQSAVVQEIQACNCIKIKEGKLVGYNTDVTGFEVSLKALLAPHHTNALVLGTGGAAKAVVFTLKKIGIHYRYVSRKTAPGHYSYEDITPGILALHTLIINTTPLGMYPDLQTFPPLPYGSLGNNHYLFDLVYNPASTIFLQKGAAQGATVKNGQDMLEIQAAESWKIWNDPTY